MHACTLCVIMCPYVILFHLLHAWISTKPKSDKNTARLLTIESWIDKWVKPLSSWNSLLSSTAFLDLSPYFLFFLLLQKARRVDTLCDEIIEFSLPDILFMATRVINMRKYHILSGDFFGHLSLVVTGTFKVFQTLGRFQESFLNPFPFYQPTFK